MAAIDRIDEHLTSNPRAVEQAGRALVAAWKAERAAVQAQDRLHEAALQRASVVNVTQDQIDEAGKKVRATRLAAMAAAAVLEKEVDR